MSVIQFRDVVAHRGQQPVLRGVSLDVERGEIVALVGRSGSGKTTLLRLVNRMVRADAGSVLIEGRSVTDWDETVGKSFADMLRITDGLIARERGAAK